MTSCQLIILTVLLIPGPNRFDELSELRLRTLTARDSLGEVNDTSGDARDCLKTLSWKPASFEVWFQPARNGRGDLLVRFPSPVPRGDSANDLVAMEWYVAKDESGAPVKAPGVVVVHESGRAMVAGRMFARGLRQRKLHTFLIHLPQYGERRSRPFDIASLFNGFRQAIADVRRARDAVCSIPLVDARHVALQGTSLGGFVAATAAALDAKYDSVFLMLAGGDLYDIVQNGKRDAAKFRTQLESAGVDNDTLKDLLRIIEPTRLAHRLAPDRTWLYSGTFDTVVPMKNAVVLARAAGLEERHHVKLFADHYSGMAFLPFLLHHIATRIEVKP